MDKKENNHMSNFSVTSDSLICFKNWLIKHNHKPNEYITFTVGENGIVPYGLTQKGFKMYQLYSGVE